MPGIPLVLWGEEQGFYVLDNTAENYIFGRQAMAPSLAWETHGCYQLGSSAYTNFPLDAASRGCEDAWNSLDHRDPSHPIRNIMKSMYQMRENYPVLNDGMYLQELSKQTFEIQRPGSNHTKSEIGMWSTLRSRYIGYQDFGSAQGNQSVWLVYQNNNVTVDYTFDCTMNDTTTSLISPFDEGSTVKNLFYPYDELTLISGVTKLKIDNSTKYNGCLKTLTLKPYEYRAYVLKAAFKKTGPMLTQFVPGHDAHLESTVGVTETQDVQFELHYSQEMSCDDLVSAISISSTTGDGSVPKLDTSSVNCTTVADTPITDYTGGIPTTWTMTGKLTGVAHGVHRISVGNVSTNDATMSTGTVDNLLFRIGQVGNPVIFPRQSNYSTSLLNEDKSGLYVSHNAAGADTWRYTLDWSHYSDWMPYTGGNSTLTPQAWNGTSKQAWSGKHVIVQYHSKLSGSDDFFQHGDLNRGDKPARRFPHLFAHGPFNQYGYDAGIANEFEQDSTGLWKYRLLLEWPGVVQVNEWGINPDGLPDQTGVLGDVDGDSVLDRMPPSSLSTTLINITTAPPKEYLGWTIAINDGNYRFVVTPTGHRSNQIAIFIILWIVPIVTAVASIWVFIKSFYSVKMNKVGVSEKRSLLPLAIRRRLNRDNPEGASKYSMLFGGSSMNLSSNNLAVAQVASGKRRMVLIATMEYDIEDWNIKIKIGGLGVMAQLMGKNLGHQDLIWVIPCVGGVDYPEDEPAEPMYITILGALYEVQVQYHRLRNITYVLLDAPVFRAQSKSEPYPARMDDLDSAVYYSSWNQCIALAMKRFPVDLYHINDYHGAIAPLHLLPETIPICLSLHNAEFQGLWPMRTPKERTEVW